MQAKREAKRRLLANVSTNIVVVVMNAGISIWTIPYLQEILAWGHMG